MLNDLGSSKDYWLGGMTQKGSWVWSDTSLFNFANWESKELVRAEQENQSFCTALNSQSGKWTTVNCRLPKSFLCRVTPNEDK
ncbi:hypothetical protein AAVH_06571 [Aphelenchoides avenae]|nr:hypothetical protein AAVH_06571 [Aphelenchus avenae]